MQNRFLNYDEYALNEVDRNTLIKTSHGDRLKRSQTVKVVFDGAKFKDELLTLQFESIDKASKGGKSWSQTVQVLEASKDDTTTKALRKAMTGNIKVNCDCPDFLYKGFQYIGTKKEYAIYDENIPPDEKNPNQEGALCKHLLAVLNKVNSLVPKISKELE